MASDLTIEALHLRGLRHLRWSPSGVGALVGPNGSGKTTALAVLELLRQALEHGLPTAVGSALGGSYDLVHHDAGDAHCLVALQCGSSRWELDLRPVGPVVEHRAADQILHDGAFVGLKRLFDTVGVNPSTDDRTLLRRLIDQGDDHPAVAGLGQALRRLAVFTDQALSELRQHGSDATHGRKLRSDGSNLFAVLRAWSERRPDEHRLGFVKRWLLESFPEEVGDFELDSQMRRVHLRLYRPGSDTPVSGPLVGQGVLSMLVSLAAIASAEPGGLVAIDEPERGLHPFAIHQLVEAARARARQDQVCVVFATHSPVLLDALEDTPDQIWVMERGQPIVPVPLSDLEPSNA